VLKVMAITGNLSDRIDHHDPIGTAGMRNFKAPKENNRRH